MHTLTITYAALFGLCFGSFANVVIYRVPRGESLIKPASRCPGCGTRIPARDLIPVLSRVLLRGKCRFCRERISVRYPAVEFCSGALFAATAVYTGTRPALIPLCLLTFILLCAAVIDYDTQEIPDGLIIFGTLLGIVWTVVFAPVWYTGLLGALCGAVPLLVIDRISILVIKKDGFGYGDVKLMAMAGLFLTPALAFVSLFFAIVAGGLFGAVLIVSGRIKKGGYFAFAPFLAAGVLSALWFGERFIRFLGFA